MRREMADQRSERRLTRLLVVEEVVVAFAAWSLLLWLELTLPFLEAI
jgi:hypothetical protein